MTWNFVDYAMCVSTWKYSLKGIAWGRGWILKYNRAFLIDEVIKLW